MKTQREVFELLDRAKASRLVGLARKVRPVDARPAKAGEIVETIIEGQGKETQSQTARLGDWIVRNRCSGSGREQYLVAAEKFAQRAIGSHA